FISQDKYVDEILKKFDFANVKSASTPKETDEVRLSTEDEVSTAKEGVSTDFEDSKAQENAQSEGRTKETDEVRLSTEDEVS
ncbi:hypothetical protein Tco_0632005, partial [Tanacetum coccineum]